MRIIGARIATGVLVSAVLGAAGCSTGNQPGNALAPDQTLRFPIQADVSSLDPALSLTFTDVAFTYELFSGLYRFDNNMKMVPDIATGPPDVSADGLNYTFHLRHDAHFWNGDPIRADDFVYSWNRAAYLNGGWATVFGPIVGADDTMNHKTTAMRGLSAPDAYTVKANLTAPAGYWLTEVAVQVAYVVDQKVVERADGTDVTKQTTWWTKPDTAVGSGPFKLTERTAKTSMEFRPVKSWYGGSTGALTDVVVDLGVDPATMVAKYESGGYDMLGFAGNGGLSLDDVIRFENDKSKRAQIIRYALGQTNWVGFNESTGPFAGVVEGHDGRQAFSMAIDRDQLVQSLCQGISCVKATGGVISKGLKGYLGDGKDTNAVFDPSRARALLKKWDPDGSKVKGLQYSYQDAPGREKNAQFLQSQWKANLGVSVGLAPMPFRAYVQAGNAKKLIMFRGQWGADYDNPQDWFDPLFSCADAGPGQPGFEAYCNPDMDRLVAQANAEPVDAAIPIYQQAGEHMISDAVMATLTYGVGVYVRKPYVNGAGHNVLYDYRWTGISLSRH